MENGFMNKKKVVTCITAGAAAAFGIYKTLPAQNRAGHPETVSASEITSGSSTEYASEYSEKNEAGSVAVNTSNQPLLSKDGFFFDTVVSISLYDTADEAVMDDCFELMDHYENLLSRTVEGSDIWKINHSGGKTVEVDPETAALIRDGLHYSEISDGAYDITIAPVVDLWDFHSEDNPKVPAAEDIAQAVTHVDYTKLKVDGNKVTLGDPKSGVDLGSIAKGFISDKLRDCIVKDGCSSAMINLGGNVMTVGTKPDGSDWRIGIRRPFGTSAYDVIDVVSVSSMSVITSGTYERYFYQDGKLYHHILDPNTGYSVDNGLSSVSILSADGTDGDALSTTCFVLGPDKGMQLIETLDGIEAAFIDEDDKITYSSGWPASAAD